jgi:A/G-specific adenine glycosylase
VWAGLWSLPEFDSLEQALAALDSLPGDPVEQPPIVHALTHFDWTLAPLHWSLPAPALAGWPPRWIERWPPAAGWQAEALSMGIAGARCAGC